MISLENSTAKVFLKKGREKSVKNFHPWIFSGAIDRITGAYSAGDIVTIFSQQSIFLAKGFVNPQSQIRIRILTFQEEPITSEFFIKRLSEAYQARKLFLPTGTNAFRAVHGDGDGLSGLVIDKYGSVLVIQIFSKGMERMRHYLRDWLEAVFAPQVIIERSEGLSLPEEGIQINKEIIKGSVPEELVIEENGIQFKVDIWNGQKTGFFLDQRDNRQRMAVWSAGKTVLNGFSYSGGFSVAAAMKGATTTSVDISEKALDMARQNFELNGLNPADHRFEAQDVFDFLRNSNEQYEVVILDPPAFIKKRIQLPRGARAYKEINRLALERVKTNGLMLSCSCSSHLNWDLFQKIIFSAAQESGRRVQIIGRYGQPSDHPINIYHPEGEYLKSLLLRII
jgi:23S rRNA (cytosine1962-C5)-methyltransferase